MWRGRYLRTVAPQLLCPCCREFASPHAALTSPMVTSQGRFAPLTSSSQLSPWHSVQPSCMNFVRRASSKANSEVKVNGLKVLGQYSCQSPSTHFPTSMGGDTRAVRHTRPRCSECSTRAPQAAAAQKPQRPTRPQWEQYSSSAARTRCTEVPAPHYVGVGDTGWCSPVTWPRSTDSRACGHATFA